MKYLTVSWVVTVSLPALAWGTDVPKPSESFSFLSSLFQMGGALTLVVGLILLTYYVSTKLLRKLPALRPGGRYIRIIETRPLAPRKALILVEVGGEYLLLASSDDNLSLVKQIGMLEEVEVLDDSERAEPFAALLNRFKAGASKTEPSVRNE